MVDPNKTTQNIRAKMKENGMTVTDVAKALCVSNQCIHNWLYKTTRMPNIDNLVLLADLFGCKVDDLIVRG